MIQTMYSMILQVLHLFRSQQREQRDAELQTNVDMKYQTSSEPRNGYKNGYKHLVVPLFVPIFLVKTDNGLRYATEDDFKEIVYNQAEDPECRSMRLQQEMLHLAEKAEEPDDYKHRREYCSDRAIQCNIVCNCSATVPWRQTNEAKYDASSEGMETALVFNQTYLQQSEQVEPALLEETTLMKDITFYAKSHRNTPIYGEATEKSDQSGSMTLNDMQGWDSGPDREENHQFMEGVKTTCRNMKLFHQEEQNCRIVDVTEELASDNGMNSGDGERFSVNPPEATALYEIRNQQNSAGTGQVNPVVAPETVPSSNLVMQKKPKLLHVEPDPQVYTMNSDIEWQNTNPPMQCSTLPDSQNRSSSVGEKQSKLATGREISESLFGSQVPNLEVEIDSADKGTHVQPMLTLSYTSSNAIPGMFSGPMGGVQSVTESRERLNPNDTSEDPMHDSSTIPDFSVLEPRSMTGSVESEQRPSLLTFEIPEDIIQVRTDNNRPQSNGTENRSHKDSQPGSQEDPLLRWFEQLKLPQSDEAPDAQAHETVELSVTQNNSLSAEVLHDSPSSGIDSFENPSPFVDQNPETELSFNVEYTSVAYGRSLEAVRSDASKENGKDITSKRKPSIRELSSSKCKEYDTDDRCILVVYAKDNSLESWISREIEHKLNCSKLNVKLFYLHKELAVPGTDKLMQTLYMTRKAFKILLVLSNKFNECDMCKYVLQCSVPHATDKIIPVASEKCKMPEIIQFITALDISSTCFWQLLSKALTTEHQAIEPPADPTLRPFRDGQEPFLLIKKRPENPVEPHIQQSVQMPSQPDKRLDHRVVFVIGYFNGTKDHNLNNMRLHNINDTSQYAPKYEVRLKLNNVYKLAQNGEATKLDTNGRAKCVRFWKDTYRQPKSQEEIDNEIAFLLRFKNPPDAHKIRVFLTFDLIMTITQEDGKSAEHMVHSLNLEFETKAKKGKMKPNPRLTRRSGSAADEDDEDGSKGCRDQSKRLYDWLISLNKDGSPAQNTCSYTPTDGVLGRGKKGIVDNTRSAMYQKLTTVRTINLDTGKEEAIPEEPITAWPAKTKPPDGFVTLITEDDMKEPDEMIEPEEEQTEYNESEQIYKGLMFKEAATIYPKPGMFRKKQYYQMCFDLDALGLKAKDETMAKLFHEEAQRLFDGYRRKQRSDEQIVILLRQSSVEHCRNNLSTASMYVRQAMDLLPRSKYRQQMEARIFCNISAIYREKKKFGKAKFWIKRARERLQCVEPGEDTAKVYYHEGRLHLKILMNTVRHEFSRMQAIQCFKNCIDHARYDYEKYGTRLDIRLVRRCFLNMARICVDLPETPVGQSRRIVTYDDLVLAKECLEAVEMPEYWQDVTVRNQAQLRLAKAGFFFRKAEIQRYMSDEINQKNCKRNMQIALNLVEDVANLQESQDHEEMKEITLAREFKSQLESSPVLKRARICILGTVNAETESSSDKSPSSQDSQDSQGELRVGTHADERKKLSQRQAQDVLMNDLGADSCN